MPDPEDPDRPENEEPADPPAKKAEVQEPVDVHEVRVDEHFDDEDAETTRSRIARLTKRLVERGGDETRHLLGTVLDGSDRAKTEMVRLMAREVRNYLEALKLKDDLMELATSHSLEIKASFSLKPLAQEPHEEAEDDEEIESEA